MDIKEIKLIIGNSPPFNKLRIKQLDSLIKISEIKEYKSGETIYKQSDPADYLYILIKGRVLALANIDGKDFEIEILKRGTCFGIISLLTEDSHSVAMRSIETSFILQIEKNNFKKFLKSNPLVALDFSRLLSQRVKSRSKPKRIFQSKKIGVMGSKEVGKTRYMFGLGQQLSIQTKKDVICIQIISGDEEKTVSSVDKDKILSLNNFKESDLSNYIVKKEIDSLYLEVDRADNFLALLNFISESYHFVLYEIPCEFLSSNIEEFIDPAHQLHLILFPQPNELNNSGVIIRELKIKNPLNQDKIKVILAQFKDQDQLSFDNKNRLLGHPIYATFSNYSDQEYAKTLKRIAREIGEVTLGLALGSGAAYGLSHIGVLKVLEENNIDIDIICGSSMGALVAALWAVGYRIDEIERLSEQFGKKLSLFSLMGLSFPFKGIMRAKRLERIFKDIFGGLTFYDLKHTLKIVVFDFIKRKTVILENGLLCKAVAASCAFPGIFEPIKFKKGIYLDGGILNPLPTKILLNFGIHKIIASNITLSKEAALKEYLKRKRLHIFDFIFGSIETMQQEFIEQAIRIADVVIQPNLEGLGWTEFERIKEFIERGRLAAQNKIGMIKELAKG